MAPDQNLQFSEICYLFKFIYNSNGLDNEFYDDFRESSTNKSSP